jgi:very-short-patch-repair endonuclease
MRARDLRNNMSDAEVRLWARLKAGRLDGHEFRRQYPMGPYVLDFVCLRAHLVVEVDGCQHAEDERLERDAIRTTWLARRGYRVIRFWSTEVMCETDEVVDGILAALHGEDTLIQHAAGFRSG